MDPFPYKTLVLQALESYRREIMGWLAKPYPDDDRHYLHRMLSEVVALEKLLTGQPAQDCAGKDLHLKDILKQFEQFKTTHGS